jgi:MFS family permease
LSLFFFEAGSAICGAANTINALIVGRAICGLGGIGVYVGVLMLLSVFTTIQERPNYMGMIGLVWGLGTVLGPVIGGAFADSSATWRWAFYVRHINQVSAATRWLTLIHSSLDQSVHWWGVHSSLSLPHPVL